MQLYSILCKSTGLRSMGTLKQFRGIELKAQGNHVQVLKDGEIVFDDVGTWAHRDGSGVFRNLCDEIRKRM